MRHRTGIVVFALAMTGASAVSAGIGIRSPVPIAVRARLDVRVLASEASGEWAVTTRSPADASRFMADLTAGNTKTGVLYIKGASTWAESDDALGRVRFDLEQGDYLYRFAWQDSAGADVRLFGDERRFFTHELGTPVVEDDLADAYEHRLGGRADAHMDWARATYWIAALDTGDDRRTNQYASLRFSPRFGYLGLGYVSDDGAPDDAEPIAKAELAAYFRPATALVSFEQAGGPGADAGDWNDFDGGYRTGAPANSATFAELRTRRTRLGAEHLLDASYQYGFVGASYVNDLSSLVPGSTINRGWIDWAHARYALDARLAGHYIERTDVPPDQRFTRGVDLTTRARLIDNAEVLLRGGANRDDTHPTDETRGFVHAAYTRELREFRGGVHALVRDIGHDPSVSAGADIRLNWSATGAISGRWIIVDEAGGSDALWVRLEYRPTRRSWVTLAYGRETRGDDVYFLEDRDAPPAIDAGNVITLTVRGDL